MTPVGSGWEQGEQASEYTVMTHVGETPAEGEKNPVGGCVLSDPVPMNTCSIRGARLATV